MKADALKDKIVRVLRWDPAMGESNPDFCDAVDDLAFTLTGETRPRPAKAAAPASGKVSESKPPRKVRARAH